MADDHIAAMQSENHLISDFVKMATSMAGTFAGMTREARDGARERFKEALGGLDFVDRDEFDAVKDMASRAREDATRLEARLAALEAQMSAQSAVGSAPVASPGAEVDQGT
jgi:BMFP domain-containing protein YqiC